MSLKKVCSRCNKIIGYGEQCSCYIPYKKERIKEYDKRYRNQDSRKVYVSNRWVKVRKIALERDNYLCQDCVENKSISNASEVHHIKPLDVGGEAYDLDNLISLCHECHMKRHSELDKKEV